MPDRTPRTDRSPNAAVPLPPVSVAEAGTPAAAVPEEAVQIETLSVQLPACLLEDAGNAEQTFTVDLQTAEPATSDVTLTYL